MRALSVSPDRRHLFVAPCPHYSMTVQTRLTKHNNAHFLRSLNWANFQPTLFFRRFKHIQLAHWYELIMLNNHSSLKGQCHKFFASPRALKIMLGLFHIFLRKFTDIFPSQGAPPVSMANFPPINDTGGTFCHRYHWCGWNNTAGKINNIRSKFATSVNNTNGK